MEPVILIGPIGSGKTTVGKLLAKKLSLPFHSLDEMAEQYTAPLGYDVRTYDLIKKQKGLFPAYEYARGFFDEAVVRFLKTHQEGILDFGGGHPVVPDPKKQKRILVALKPYQNIFLLMPTKDTEESILILRKRNKVTESEDFNMLYFKDRTFWKIAKHIVYTKGRTPTETYKEIAAKIEIILSSPPPCPPSSTSSPPGPPSRCGSRLRPFSLCMASQR